MVSVTMLVEEVLVSGEDTPTAGDGVEWAWMWCKMHGGEERGGQECDTHWSEAWK